MTQDELDELKADTERMRAEMDELEAEGKKASEEWKAIARSYNETAKKYNDATEIAKRSIAASQQSANIADQLKAAGTVTADRWGWAAWAVVACACVAFSRSKRR